MLTDNVLAGSCIPIFVGHAAVGWDKNYFASCPKLKSEPHDGNSTIDILFSDRQRGK